MILEIKKHAYKRAKERLGLNKNAFKNLVTIAISKGYSRAVLKNNLRKWVDSRVLKNKNKFSVLLYSDFMLLYTKDSVISVYKIPRDLIPINRFIIKAKDETIPTPG